MCSIARGSGGKFQTSGDDITVMPSGRCGLKCTNQARCLMSSTDVEKNACSPLASGRQMTPYPGYHEIVDACVNLVGRARGARRVAVGPVFELGLGAVPGSSACPSLPPRGDLAGRLQHTDVRVHRSFHCLHPVGRHFLAVTARCSSGRSTKAGPGASGPCRLAEPDPDVPPRSCTVAIHAYVFWELLLLTGMVGRLGHFAVC